MLLHTKGLTFEGKSFFILTQRLINKQVTKRTENPAPRVNTSLPQIFWDMFLDPDIFLHSSFQKALPCWIETVFQVLPRILNRIAVSASTGPFRRIVSMSIVLNRSTT